MECASLPSLVSLGGVDVQDGKYFSLVYSLVPWCQLVSHSIIDTLCMGRTQATWAAFCHWMGGQGLSLGCSLPPGKGLGDCWPRHLLLLSGRLGNAWPTFPLAPG